jgi:hypothetical protein
MIYFFIFLILLECYFAFKLISYFTNRSIIKDYEKFKQLALEDKDFEGYGCLKCKDRKFYLLEYEIPKEQAIILLNEVISFYKKRGVKWI